MQLSSIDKVLFSLVEEFLNPRHQRLPEKFVVNITKRWCDYGKLQNDTCHVHM